MTLANLQSTIRQLTNSDTTSYSDTDLNLNLTNAAKFLTGELLNSMMDWKFQGDTATANLVASTTIANRYYAFPTNFLKLQRVDIMADGTNWYRCSYIDIGEISDALGKEADVTNNYTNTEPHYSIVGNKILILSGTLIAVTDGIRYYFAENIVGKDAAGADIASFATSTDTPNVPDPFQMGLCYFSAKIWFQKYQNTDMARVMDAELEKIIARMNQFKVTDEKLMFKPASELENYD